MTCSMIIVQFSINSINNIGGKLLKLVIPSLIEENPFYPFIFAESCMIHRKDHPSVKVSNSMRVLLVDLLL